MQQGNLERRLMLIGGQDLLKSNQTPDLNRDPLNEGICKDDMGVLITWFGKRTYDRADLACFEYELNFWRPFHLYGIVDLSDADEEDGSRLYLERKAEELGQRLKGISNPLAVFVVLTPELAEFPEFGNFPQRLKQYQEQSGKSSTIVYKIIMDGPRFSQEGPKDPDGHFSQKAMRAHELGGIYLPYNHDFQTIGSIRLIDYIGRVMGTDLPGEEFPNYSLGDLRKMAWHISREDFNAFSPREGAIPKYPIIDGRPLFLF